MKWIRYGKTLINLDHIGSVITNQFDDIIANAASGNNHFVFLPSITNKSVDETLAQIEAFLASEEEGVLDIVKGRICMETRKIVINVFYGGFSLSDAAVRRLRELGCEAAWREVLVGEVLPDGSIEEVNWGYLRKIQRDDPLLVRVVEELGELASGRVACLRVVEIPADVEWVISEHDGMETVDELHRSWS